MYQHKQIMAFKLESAPHGGERGHVLGTHSEPSKTSMMELPINFSRKSFVQYMPF